ncbi:uncharacterized protein LOC123306930 [Coccinella septempunctata]|uniref:uncharacterized protein LOC123306930 n=1 Tax=Coccinella septempunctata TaxID=41139 RepID=UPI001D08BDF0|nr:uncharacterized protein LOC123306930 [Coccinella septempunctata]
MDHLSQVLSKSFHDSEIAKSFSCRRTKSAAIAYNVIGSRFEKILQEDIKGSFCTYSIIIDESTDISTTKVLGIAIKYFSEKDQMVKTRFLCSVDLQGETAEHLFGAMKVALEERDLHFKNMIGFAADTTNVIFGEKSGVVAKIKEQNPNCILVKCVCHSVALSVSYACRVLPRGVEQLVKEVYGYFSQSSKRQREFQEFQSFTNSEQHKILRLYDIRWLSLHACVSRILEQWSPLQLFFNGQYLEDKRQHASCEFLFNAFNDETVKLYLNFLDFILPIANKFNVIFQGDYPVVHRVYRDISEMLSSILSCYMTSNYVRNTPIEDIDPKCTSQYLPLQSLYLGHKVSTHLNNCTGKISVEAINDFLTRCQSFLIE